jgi:hypothetical protein
MLKALCPNISFLYSAKLKLPVMNLAGKGHFPYKNCNLVGFFVRGLQPEKLQDGSAKLIMRSTNRIIEQVYYIPVHLLLP